MRRERRSKVMASVLAGSMAVMVGLSGCGSAGMRQSSEGGNGTSLVAVDNSVSGSSAVDGLEVSENGTSEEADKAMSVEAVSEDDTEAVESTITVQKVADIPDDFMFGADVSSYLSEKDAGVRYFDFDGNEVDDAGFFSLLKDSGFTTIRIRVWNDPYDENGHTYGGGNCDIENAVKMGKLATDAGLGVLIDFHYSDFWADPGKQKAPKAWEKMKLDEKTQALHDYTADSLQKLSDSGVNVVMVQIGNETTTGFCGEKDWTKIAELMNAGSSAVREYSKNRVGQESSYGEQLMDDVLVAVHFTNPEKEGNLLKLAERMDKYEVDYDVFETSYYPYWHGTLENLTALLTEISDKYDKKVCVGETSYIHTYLDGDGSPNTEYEGKMHDAFPYPISEQGQAMHLRNVVQAVVDCGNSGIGVFYWEPAWIPVNVVQQGAAGNSMRLEENKKAWEEIGCGWATSFSGDYDSDAAMFYGGSAVDNEALFDFNGYALESLRTFKYVRTGAIAPLAITQIDDTIISIAKGSEVNLPKTVHALYNDGSEKEVAVHWDETMVKGIDVNTPGDYEIYGEVVDIDLDSDITNAEASAEQSVETGASHAATADESELTEVYGGEISNTFGEIMPHLTVKVEHINYLQNPGFEDNDMSMWKISDTGKSVAREPDSDNLRSGDYCLKFWENKKIDYTVEQTVTLDPGTYTYGTWVEGGDAGPDADFHIYVIIDGKETDQTTGVSKWMEWSNPEMTFTIDQKSDVTCGISVKAAAGAWGAWDDFYLYANDQ